MTVSDDAGADGFSCTPSSPVAALAPNDTVVCTGTHTITQADLDAGSFHDVGTADSNETPPVDASDTIFGKHVPTVTTTIHAGKGADDQANATEIFAADFGSTVHDQANVSGDLGAATGTVSFTVYTSKGCETGPSAAGTVAVASGIAHPSNDAVVGANGLSFRAHYNGDGNYLEANGPCENLDVNPRLTVTKIVVGDTTTTFDLSVNTTMVIDNGLTGATDTRSFAPGTYVVSETLGDGNPVDTNLWDVKFTGDCNDQGSVTVTFGDTKSCTITNSKRPQINVKKVVKNGDPGKFDLGINGTTYDNSGAGFGNGGETGFQVVPVGDAKVFETGHAPTKLSSYYNDVECDTDKGEATGGDRMNYEYPFKVAYGDKVTCTFTNERKESSIDVTKTPSPTSVNEPGGNVTFTVKVTNTSKVDDITLSKSGFEDAISKSGSINIGNPGTPVDITNLVDCNGPGNDVAHAGNGLPLTLKVGEFVSCTFDKSVQGDGGQTEYDKVTVTGKNETGDDVKDDGDAQVDIKDVLPTIQVDKSANPTHIDEPGGLVTFTVEVKNTSVEPVTLKDLVDVPYGDLFDDAGNSQISDSTCVDDTVIATGDTYTCSFKAMVSGDGGQDKTDIVTGKAYDNENNKAEDEGTATVHIDDVLPTIQVDKSANPTHIDEPGGLVTFTVKVKNTSTVESVTLKELVDAPYGDLFDDAGNGQISDSTCVDDTVIASGDTYTCSFTAMVSGNAGDDKTDVVTGKAYDNESNKAEDDGTATVHIDDIPTKLSVVKDANPESVQEGTRAITFTVTMTNVLTFTQDGKTYTAVDDITVFSLQDNKLGDLDAAGDVICKVGGVTESWPITIGPGQSIVCSVTRNVTGSPSSPHSNTATATGFDSDHPNGCVESSVEPFCKTASDGATVTFTATPPPPPNPRSDVTVTKTATPAVQLPQGGGTAAITYNIAAKNNGPDAAANVKVSDAAPAGVTFVSATTGKGTCTTTAQAVDCTISSLAVGESVPITINATVSATGTMTNVVIISNTSPPDTNPNNNTASASTVVNAPLTPPVVKPKPPEVCELLTVLPKTLKATGKAQKIVVKVTKGKKAVAGATVKITGPGISKTVKTGKNGKVVVTIKPGKPGIIKIAIQGAKTCNTQRIGVVGIFEPPVTG